MIKSSFKGVLPGTLISLICLRKRSKNAGGYRISLDIAPIFNNFDQIKSLQMLKRGLLLSLVCSLFLTTGYAKHIVGGELFYNYQGAGNYQVTLKLYRDCTPNNTPYDPTVWVFVYRSNGTLADSIPMAFPGATQLPAIVNSCSSLPGGVCVEEAVYTANKNLPPVAGGYTLVFQRCCRNNTILNVQNPGSTGATYMIQIPDPGVVPINSSPHFNAFPPIFICANAQFSIDNSATDPDRDSLVYSLCDAYDGASTCCPLIDPAGIAPSGAGCPSSCPYYAPPPPYAYVNYVSPYNGSNPMSASPAVSINPVTGMLTGTPNLIGQWVVAVCVSEYRHGRLLSVNKRDFQFNVTSCTPKAVTAVTLPATYCSGDTAHFINNSLNATSYLWNFGDPISSSNSSALVTPTHVYADTGVFQVTLICNPGTPCADTGTTSFSINPLPKPSFLHPGPQCIFNNSFGYSAGGQFGGTSTFQWEFGLQAAPSSSTIKDPPAVHYLIGGTFPVSLTIKDRGCVKTYSDSVQVLNLPVMTYSIPTLIGCASYSITYVAPVLSSAYQPIYSWSFGDGTSSSIANPSHEYSLPGTYNVNLLVITTKGCLDTFRFAGPFAVTVHPAPEALFHSDSLSVSVKHALVQFNMLGQGCDSVSCLWLFGDGSSMNVCKDTISHLFPAVGTYPVREIVTNSFGCKDTFLIPIEVYSYFDYWIPNAFTPNGDGRNDFFGPVIEGVTNYEFLIFNRWGELMFSTENIFNRWDGTYKGSKCQEDVYVWKIAFRNEITQSRENYIGRVTLIR